MKITADEKRVTIDGTGNLILVANGYESINIPPTFNMTFQNFTFTGVPNKFIQMLQAFWHVNKWMWKNRSR